MSDNKMREAGVSASEIYSHRREDEHTVIINLKIHQWCMESEEKTASFISLNFSTWLHIQI